MPVKGQEMHLKPLWWATFPTERQLTFYTCSPPHSNTANMGRGSHYAVDVDSLPGPHTAHTHLAAATLEPAPHATVFQSSGEGPGVTTIWIS